MLTIAGSFAGFAVTQTIRLLLYACSKQVKNNATMLNGKMALVSYTAIVLICSSMDHMCARAPMFPGGDYLAAQFMYLWRGRV